MKPFLIRIVTGGMVCFVAGCATGARQETLHLESVMDLKRQREAARLETLKNEQMNSFSALHALIEKSSYEAGEIELLEIPVGFRRLAAREIESLRAEAPAEMPPFAEAVWVEEDSGVLIAAGGAVMGGNGVNRMSRPEFKEELKNVGETFDAYYDKEYSAQTGLVIKDAGSGIRAEVTAKYLRENRWFTHQRMFYFFRPGYRFILMISGPDQALMELGPSLRQMEALFEKKILVAYPQGLDFDGEGVADVAFSGHENILSNEMNTPEE